MYEFLYVVSSYRLIFNAFCRLSLLRLIANFE